MTRKNERTKGRPVQDYTGWAQRRRERYAILRDVMGCNVEEAMTAYCNVFRFQDMARSKGFDPEQWPELIAIRIGGRPRSASPSEHRIKRIERYRLLRDVGLMSKVATRYSQGPGTFQYAMRRLQKGLPL